MRAGWLLISGVVLGLGLGTAASADVLPVSFEALSVHDSPLAPVSASPSPRRIEVGGGPDPVTLALLTAGLAGLGLLGGRTASEPRGVRQGTS